MFSCFHLLQNANNLDKELYIGVDVSKKTLDLAYYDGETIDWKNAHIKVSNDDAGFKKIAPGSER